MKNADSVAENAVAESSVIVVTITIFPTLPDELHKTEILTLAATAAQESVGKYLHDHGLSSTIEAEASGSDITDDGEDDVEGS